MDYQVIIPAAGQGKRMKAGRNKQFIELNNKPIIIHTLEVFEADVNCKGIVLVVNDQEIHFFEELISKYHISKVKKIEIGGRERQDSVYNGLKALSEDGIVLIHDGARPFISHEIIKNLVKKASEQGAAIAAVPVKDTIKLSKDHDIVNGTLERSSLWAVQTPQAFRLSLILKAHEDALEYEFIGTDDASLVERMKQKVYIVKGDYQNIKITTPEDLLFGRAILEAREKRGGNE